MVIVDVSPGEGPAAGVAPPVVSSAAPQLLQKRASSALLCPHWAQMGIDRPSRRSIAAAMLIWWVRCQKNYELGGAPRTYLGPGSHPRAEVEVDSSGNLRRGSDKGEPVRNKQGAAQGRSSPARKV